MKIVLKALFAVATTVIALSCAKQEDTPYNPIEQQALEKWLAVNAPDAVRLGETDIYYEVTGREDAGGVTKLKPAEWAIMQYTIKDLSGNTVVTRSKTEAKKLGTYTPYAHYVPNMIYIASTEGQNLLPKVYYHAALSIPPGETWRLYVPSSYGFGSTVVEDVVGYGGQVTLGANKPFILDDVRILERIPDPETREVAILDKYAMDVLELEKSNSPIYLKVTSNDEIPVADREYVKENEAAYIYFTAYFIENGKIGQMIDTNYSQKWLDNYGQVRLTDNTDALTVTHKKETTTVNGEEVTKMVIGGTMPSKPFTAIIDLLYYGASGYLVVGSQYAYDYLGRGGNRPTNTTSYPYDDSGYGEKSIAYFDTHGSSVYSPNYSTSDVVIVPEVKPFTPIVYEFYVSLEKPEN